MTTNQNILLRSASFELTMTSADSGKPVKRGTSLQTATQAVRCPVIEVTLDDDHWPDGYRSPEQLVSEAEKDPIKRAALEDARRWAADTYYAGENSLRTLRLKKGVSQAKLAEQLGTTQSHIARIENATTDVQVGTLLRVAEALGIADVEAFKAFVALRRASSVYQT